MGRLDIRPVSDLRNNYPAIEKAIKEGPVFFTKNGYGTAVYMSLDTYLGVMDHGAKLAEAERYAAEHTERLTLDEVVQRQQERIHVRNRVSHRLAAAV